MYILCMYVTYFLKTRNLFKNIISGYSGWKALSDFIFFFKFIFIFLYQVHINFIIFKMPWFVFLLEKEEKGRERDRETSICCSNYLCIHLLIFVCALSPGIKPATLAEGVGEGLGRENIRFKKKSDT